MPQAAGEILLSEVKPERGIAMKKKRSLNLIARIGLFFLILGLGTLAALVMGETKGLALADLSGASVQAVATTLQDQVWYAGLSDGPQPTGIYRSDDRGLTWQMVNSGPGLPVNALAVHPANESVLYAGTAGGPLTTATSVWRSDDGGQTWHKFFLSLPANPYRLVPAVTALAVDPQQPEVLYVGTDGQGVYRFDEKRLGYELLGGLSLYNAYVKDVVIGPDSQIYALTNNGLFVTRGDSWQKLESLPEVAVSLAVAPSDPQTLYAGCPSSGAYRSTDGGQTWESISHGLGIVPGVALRVTALAVDEWDSQRVVAGTAYGLGSRLAGQGIYESRDGGHHWTKVGDADGLVKRLITADGAIYAATTTGLRRYGNLSEPAPTISLSDLRRLASPTANQVLILSLTVGLAIVALLGRLEWITGRVRCRA
jgi:photosystem II stability/assembly factor-like uncharacterized protein